MKNTSYQKFNFIKVTLCACLTDLCDKLITSALILAAQVIPSYDFKVRAEAVNGISIFFLTIFIEHFKESCVTIFFFMKYTRMKKHTRTPFV